MTSNAAGSMGQGRAYARVNADMGWRLNPHEGDKVLLPAQDETATAGPAGHEASLRKLGLLCGSVLLSGSAPLTNPARAGGFILRG